MYCEKCGTQVEAGIKFCPTCGSKMEVADQSANEPAYTQNFQDVVNSQPVYDQANTTETYKPKVNSTPFLVWSIINLVCCCLPLGIAGIVFVVKAGNATTQEEADKALKTSKTLNLIGSISGAVLAIAYVALMAFGVFSTNSYMGY